MKDLKTRITENGIDYVLVGDYYIPDLKLPEEKRSIGKWGRMHREYLKKQCYGRYSDSNYPESSCSSVSMWRFRCSRRITSSDPDGMLSVRNFR